MDILDNSVNNKESSECNRLKRIYYEACGDHGTYFLDPLIDIIEGHSPTGSFLDLRGNLKSFRKEKLKDNDFHPICIELQSDVFVTSMDLSYNTLSDEVCVSLGKALVKNNKLTELNVTMCDIGEEGCYAICKGLEYNTCLETLILEANDIGAVGSTSIASVLQINTSLSKLNIASTNQTSQSLIPLCTVLRMNTSIKHLDVSRTIPFTDEQTLTDHFSGLLTHSKSLVSLTLSKCGINDWGAYSLAFTLRNNTSLKHLNLSSNKISADGAKHFSELLKTNASLEELSLCSNRIGDAGLMAISEVLACRNSSLRKLWVTNNAVSGAGLSSLAAALHENRSLVEVYVWGNTLDERACDAFKTLLAGEEPRIASDGTDVELYTVDNMNYLAERGQFTFSH